MDGNAVNVENRSRINLMLMLTRKFARMLKSLKINLITNQDEKIIEKDDHEIENDVEVGEDGQAQATCNECSENLNVLKT